MKLRKTRIKKTTTANGSVQYTAEYKWGFCWYTFTDMMAADTEACSIYYEWAKTQLVTRRSEKEAKDLIDFYISRVKHVNACLIENEIVKTECERYP